jgi:hypothetical protein
MRNPFIVLAVVLALTSCSKHDLWERIETQKVIFLSDKYHMDSSGPLQIDTLKPWGVTANYLSDVWHGGVMVDSSLTQVRRQNDSAVIRLCANQMLEIRRNLIGNQISKPKIFK